MSDLLKGNFKTKKELLTPDNVAQDKAHADVFEAKALEKLGGSIAFVSKSKLVWSGDDAK